MEAFPLEIEDYRDHNAHPQKGMDLRDYFAAKAMQGMVLDYIPERKIPDTDLTELDVLVERAYKIADAMLKAREEGDE